VADAGFVDRPVAPAGPLSAADIMRQAPALGAGGLPIGDLMGGVRSALARTVYGGGDVVRRATGQSRILDTPEVVARTTAPDSPAGRFGSVMGDVAQVAIPATRAAGVMRGAGLLKRAATDAAIAGTVAGAQTAGDPVSTGLAMAGGAAFPVLAQVAGGVVGAGVRAARGAREGGVGGAIAGAIRKAAPGEPRTLLIQALKPRSTKVHFPSALDRALPVLGAAEGTLGRPIATLDDLVEATTIAKRQVQASLDTLRGQAGSVALDRTPIAEAMTRSIPKKVRLENPEAVARLQATADVYRRKFSLEDAETLLRETNAELTSFYAMYPQAQRAATTAHSPTAALDAQAKALRSVIDDTLDAWDVPGRSGAGRELRRRCGS
jgi:hypothetical protein